MGNKNGKTIMMWDATFESQYKAELFVRVWIETPISHIKELIRTEKVDYCHKDMNDEKPYVVCSRTQIYTICKPGLFGGVLIATDYKK